MRKVLFLLAVILCLVLSINNIKYARILDLEKQLSIYTMKYSDKDFDINSKMTKVKFYKNRIDAGDDFIHDVLKYNNRLDYYELYIKLAKEKGYIVTSFEDYLENYIDTDKKVMILRHDIDEISSGSQKMFEIEKRNNVKATYYFRWVTINQELIAELHAAGFEVGLHYETLARYCDQYNKNTVTDDDLEKCRQLLKGEIRQFKNLTGINIKTIASHGAPTNRRLKIPNKILMEDQRYSDFGIKCEVYDKVVLNKINSYISDYDLNTNYGFKYKSNPIESIMANKQVIQFLSHPNHWSYSIEERAEMISILK